MDSTYRGHFIATFFSTQQTLQNCLELSKIIGHRLGTADGGETRGLLSLLAVLISEAQSYIKEADIVALKENLFVRPSTVKRLAMRREVNGDVQSGLRELLQSSFDPRSTNDRRILSEVTAYWLAFLQDCLVSGEHHEVGAVIPSITAQRLFTNSKVQ